jgi:hypothetical protein
MKRWGVSVLAFLVVALLIFGVYHTLEKRAQQGRESGYKAALRSYSSVLKSGMKRKEVEDYLHARNIPFRQMCCVDGKKLSKGVYDDLTKIGAENAPWYCSENIVYIAFQFSGPARKWTAEPSDVLESISVYRSLEGCL